MHTASEVGEIPERAHGLLLLMAARVERQLDEAIGCLDPGSAPPIYRMLRHEIVIKDLQHAVEGLASQIIVRQAPAARDLRLLLAFMRIATDLGRIGDEAKKIALRARSVSEQRWPSGLPQVRGIGRLVEELLRLAINALERPNSGRLAESGGYQSELDASLRDVQHRVIGYMVEDPRTISASLDLLFVATCFERIGAHATNVLEHLESAVTGKTAGGRDPATS